MPRRWVTWSVVVGVLGLALLSVNVARAPPSPAQCPTFVHSDDTSFAMYTPTDGSIYGIITGNGPGFGPGGWNSTNPGVLINASQAQQMMCDMYQNSGTADYSLPWHVDLTTLQVVPS
jgi:hypothetical protein